MTLHYMLRALPTLSNPLWRPYAIERDIMEIMDPIFTWASLTKFSSLFESAVAYLKIRGMLASINALLMSVEAIENVTHERHSEKGGCGVLFNQGRVISRF